MKCSLSAPEFESGRLFGDGIHTNETLGMMSRFSLRGQIGEVLLKQTERRLSI